jgi:hypothetical protein
VIFGRNEKEIVQPVRHLYSIADPQFLRSIDGLLGPTLVAGNRVETLLNGDEIFPAMLEAIRTAEKHYLPDLYLLVESGQPREPHLLLYEYLTGHLTETPRRAACPFSCNQPRPQRFLMLDHLTINCIPISKTKFMHSSGSTTFLFK